MTYRLAVASIGQLRLLNFICDGRASGGLNTKQHSIQCVKEIIKLINLIKNQIMII